MTNELLLEILIEQIFTKEIDPLGTVSVFRDKGRIIAWTNGGDTLTVHLLAELRASAPNFW